MKKSYLVLRILKNTKEKYDDYKLKINDLDHKIIGEGVKEIPSYKCAMPFDELKALRDQFWQSKFVIREICKTDAASAVELLEATGLVCKDNLWTIFELNDPDIIYNVPNFCVANPVFREILINWKRMILTVKVKIYQSLTNPETIINTHTHTFVKDLKVTFAEKENYPLDKYKLRLFYSGKRHLIIICCLITI